jgi:hypothetical protein
MSRVGGPYQELASGLTAWTAPLAAARWMIQDGRCRNGETIRADPSCSLAVRARCLA